MAENEAATLAPVAWRERYSWHAGAWSSLTRDPARLPHALLLHGPSGLGKRPLAWRLAAFLLCASPRDAACEACTSCRRFEAGTHPDLLHVRPIGESVAIGVDQVRDLREFVALRPHTAARKLVILEPADAMNPNAANALLKVLEEPPAASILVLVAAWLARVPATIRSRCALVALRPPPVPEAAAWLRDQGVENPEKVLLAASGAPLRALALAAGGGLATQERIARDLAALEAGSEDPLRCAARWKEYGAQVALEGFQRYLAGRIRDELSRAAGAPGNTKKIRDLFSYSDALSEARGLVPGPLDEGLLLEDLLIRWARLHQPHGLN